MEGEWSIFNLADRWSFWPVTLTDGSKQFIGILMRRKVNGVWEYRKPTPEEESNYIVSEMW